MKSKYINFVHPTFSLNGQKLDFFSLREKANHLKLSKDQYLLDLANLINEWFSDSEYITLNTSGTTGPPKIIKIPKKAMIASALATQTHFKIPNSAKALHCLPIQYIAGKMMFVRAIILGWNLIYIKPTSAPLLNLADEFDFVAMVPLQVQNSISKIQNIKKLIIGGAKLNYDLKNELLRFETEIYETYGMTETVTHIAAKLIQENAFKALPNVTFTVDSRDCLIVKADKIANEIITTNDVVELISNTEFIWLGRADNVINSGGIKIFPEKIEEKLLNIISDRFFVAGIYDKVLGDKLILVIEGEKKSEISLSKINLEKYEIPKEIYYTKCFLETETGKIKRKEILKQIGF